MAKAVRVDGLADLRRDLRVMQPQALKEVRAVVKGAAEVVAAQARQNAPFRSGALRDSIKGTRAGAAGVVRSPLPYAKVHEYGGQIRPRGVPITIKRSEFVGRALEAKQEAIADALERGFDGLARRNGWT